MNLLTYDGLSQEYLNKKPATLMAEHGKSFYFASTIFSKRRLVKIATLYRLCRFIDDCADELPDEESQKAVDSILFDLDNPTNPTDFNLLVTQVEHWGVKRSYIRELVIGAKFDADGKELHTLRDLLLYCYRVAGVVGLMMCPLIGVKEEKAYPHAIDLGIGMQLTNISRDILEDAKMGRSYIPHELLGDLSIESLSAVGRAPVELKEIVKKLLDTADQYYYSAYQGLSYIPFRPRFVIILAGEIYRHIGKKIRKNNYEVLEGRTYLSFSEKVWVTLKTLYKICDRKFWKPKFHIKELHQLISDCPGVNR